MRVGPEGILPPPEDAEITQQGVRYWPGCVEACLRHAVEITGKPAHITENGIATGDDNRRRDYLEGALGGLANCLRDGLDIRGYMYWSCLDTYKWAVGYEPKLGLVEWDPQIYARTAHPSVHWYGDIARANRY